MFATLLGALPRPPLPSDAPRVDVLDAVVALQVDSGLEPVTDGGWPMEPDDPVASWRATSDRTDRHVKAVITGPYSSAADAGRVRTIIEQLAAAGCRWIEVQEPAATRIGTDPQERARFGSLHRDLTADVATAIHLSLAITGGNADAAGIETVLAGAFASLAVDLIDGPDNWRLVAVAPSERGIICGALSTRPRSDDGPEVLLWAAGYAASTKGRGSDRVGLATAGSLAGLAWEDAATKVRRLGEAADLATRPVEEQRRRVDPRAVDPRSAALGRYDPPGLRPTRRRPGPPPG